MSERESVWRIEEELLVEGELLTEQELFDSRKVVNGRGVEVVKVGSEFNRDLLNASEVWDICR
jgi:hypothetical protein